MDVIYTLRYSLEEVEMALFGLSNTLPEAQDSQLTQSSDFVIEMRMFTAQLPGLFRQPVPISQIEVDRMVVNTFEEDLWRFFKIEGVLVPEVLFKECQRRLYEVQSQSPPIPHDPVFQQSPPTPHDIAFLRTSLARLSHDPVFPQSSQGTPQDIVFLQKSLDNLIHNPVFLEKSLELLSKAHHRRKTSPLFYKSPFGKGNWKELESTPPSDDMRELGPRFWALIIGNDEYPAHRLGGCVNDANLIRNHLKNHLGVPDDHIRLLKNASRRTITDNLYDLRDDKRIAYGDNILIHFSGHGTSYEASQYFSGPVSSKGSIEAICPIDRGPEIPDISDRELNSILLEVLTEKGENITVILDCCHAGGSLRIPQPERPDHATRYLNPLRIENALDLRRMLKEGNFHTRRRRHTDISSESWKGYSDGIVQLAGCHDFQQAKEADFYQSNNPSHPTERVDVGFNSSLQELEVPSDFPRGKVGSPTKGKAKPKPPMSHSPSSFPPSHLPTASMPTLAPPAAHLPLNFLTPAPAPVYEPTEIQPSPPRYGCFTWALVKVLESEIGRNGTYESVITSIGNLSVTQDPVLLGKRKVSRLWYRE